MTSRFFESTLALLKTIYPTEVFASSLNLSSILSAGGSCSPMFELRATGTELQAPKTWRDTPPAAGARNF